MKYLIVLCGLFFSFGLFAQPVEEAEEVFQVVEEMPRFPGCEDLTKTSSEIKRCADQKMLEFIYANIEYPVIDREEGNQGTAVISFVVEKDGRISNAKILRDPGEQLGEEALRVVNLMNEMPEKWSPGIQKGKPVRVQFNLPVKYKFEEVVEPDFVLSGKDSVWVRFDTPLEYKGGIEALNKYIEKTIKYPNEGQDSCRIGIVEVNTLVNADGSVKIIDIIDYSDLGIDYQFDAISTINASTGNWTPATLEGRNVNANKAIRITYRPNLVSCGEVIGDFAEADQAVDEATILLQEENMEEGIAKLTKAIEMFPDNGEYLSLRGQAYLKMQKTEEACVDLQLARDILVVSWYDSLIPLLCK